MLRPINDGLIRSHLHRSGWPYAMRALLPLFDATSRVVFDDFLEKTFFKKRPSVQAHSQPWVGVMHHPPDVPSWYETEHPQTLDSVEEWRSSLAHLRLCVTFSENVASWVRSQWGVQCITVHHPTAVPRLTWSPDRFARNETKLLVQVGWYLRNTHAIHQVEAPPLLRKAWLRQITPLIARNHEMCRTALPRRPNMGSVSEIPALPNIEYDRLLAENVVFIELITAAANNTVIECIARNTPIILNRHPGPEFYLGAAYPLFYDNFDALPGFITPDRIVAAHEYLRHMDKGWLRGAQFRNSLRESCVRYVPESQGAAGGSLRPRSEE